LFDVGEVRRKHGCSSAVGEYVDTSVDVVAAGGPANALSAANCSSGCRPETTATPAAPSGGPTKPGYLSSQQRGQNLNRLGATGGTAVYLTLIVDTELL
jgi:hypothetical protein